MPAEVRQRPPWIELVKSGFRQARNPRILLAYACAMTSRGDMVVSGLFVSLWATMAVKAAGGEAAVAQYQVFLPFAVIQIFAVVFSFVFGSILDKVNRVVGLVLALALCVAGYGAMYFVESPLDLKILPLFAVLGCAMAAAMMSSMALIGQEAPPRERGAVIGLMSVFGSVGNHPGGRASEARCSARPHPGRRSCSWPARRRYCSSGRCWSGCWRRASSQGGGRRHDQFLIHRRVQGPSANGRPPSKRQHGPRCPGLPSPNTGAGSSTEL